MKPGIIAFLILSLWAKNNFAQLFEGEIIYQNSYKSKVSSFSDAQWKSIVGSQNLYFIMGGNYKSELNGSVVAAYTYLAKDNMLYTEFRDGNIMYWSDASESKDSIISFEVRKNAVHILGYNCDELILHTKKGTQTYDYAPLLAADPLLYVNHRFGNWNEYLKIAGLFR